MLARINRLLDVPLEDSDASRRSRLLNIILLAVSFLAVLLIVSTLLVSPGNLNDAEQLLIFVTLGFLAIMGVSFALNRNGYGRIASWIFLIILSVAVAFGDLPEEVIHGRSAFLFTIPILMASAVLPTYSSFILAAIANALIVLLSLLNNIRVEPSVLISFFLLAFVAWLAARSLEQALRELRVTNTELDQRVIARTAELQMANVMLTEQATALEVARDQALMANKFKSEMLAKVSHELRTPLGAILGYAEIMLAELPGKVNDKQRDMLSKIVLRNKDLTLMVSDLLDQSQLESGRIRLEIREMKPADLLEKVCAVMEPRAEEKGIQLNTHLENNLPELILGDFQRLEQILSNLVGNAIKFTEDGSVSMVLCRVNDEKWCMQVSDTGVGISEQEQKQVFEPFRQVDGSVTRDHEGFGLGLSIVQQFSAAMQGEIELESELGQGSTFRVVLPLNTVDAPKRL